MISEDDLLCSDIRQTINALSIPSLGRNLDSLTTILTNVGVYAGRMNDSLRGKCAVYGANSWFLGAWSFAHFYIDQSQRKHMIYKVAEALIDGKDIDGQDHSIENGVKKTFEKNLTFINKKAFQSSTTPSLFQHSSLTGKTVGDLLDDQPVDVAGLYSRLQSGSGRDGCVRDTDWLIHPPRQVTAANHPENEKIKDILIGHTRSNANPWPTCATSSKGFGCGPSAGLTKKPALVVYYGVKAELEYKTQIFLPFPLKLQAKAIAKPFGGRIGSSDPLVGANAPNYGISNIPAPNYSRYPGDDFGLRSKLVHHYWAETLQRTRVNQKHIKNYMKLEYFWHDRDPMARDTLGNTNRIARWWEIMAVAPDLFDVTYFTILPYYQYDYFPRLAKGILAGKPYLRGDLGTYCDTNPCNASSFAGTSLLTQVIGDSFR